MTDWTLEQAAELCLEQMLELLDGCDDEDSVRPAIAFDAFHQAWSPSTDLVAPEITAGEMRTRIARARKALAEGELIP